MLLQKNKQMYYTTLFIKSEFGDTKFHLFQSINLCDFYITMKSPLCPIGSPAHVDLSSVLGCSRDQALTLNGDRHLNQTKLLELGKLLSWSRISQINTLFEYRISKDPGNLDWFICIDG